MNNDLQRLCRNLNYTFTDPRLLKQALTHCSAGTVNNERLEFLGDSVLSLVITNDLFMRFPAHSEGQLSRLRAYLVKGDMLATLAQDMQLGNLLYLGQGELRSGGFRRASILADALEAIFGAIFIDGGFLAVQQVILHVYQKELNAHNLEHKLHDSKTQLQEYLQAHKYPLPIYVLNQVVGEEHEQLFSVTCEVKKLDVTTTGQGETRRKAEQQAAQRLYEKLTSIIS